MNEVRAASPGPSRIERRKARTRAAILAAAAGLFHERGFEATAIVDIAERADTGAGTLYGYFGSKEEILREVVRQSFHNVIARYWAVVDEHTPAIDRLLFALEQFAAYVAENRTLLSSTVRIPLNRAPSEGPFPAWVVASVRDMVQQGVAGGELRPVPIDTTVRMLLNTYLMANLGAGVWQGHEDDPETAAGLAVITRSLLERSPAEGGQRHPAAEAALPPA